MSQHQQHSMICPKCQCKCLILPYQCLYDADERLKDICIEDKPQLLNMVNSFILIGTEKDNGLLKNDCFHELCRSIKEAQQSANEENSDQENVIPYEASLANDQGKPAEFWDYLPSKWTALLRDMHFQNMYAAYLMYYHYTLQSISISSKDGEVKSVRNRSANNSRSTENIDLKEAKYLASVQLNIAKSFTAIFKREFLEKRKGEYCNEPDECSCGKRECPDCSGLKIEPNRGRPKAGAL